ncbi:putative Inositol monophosphatase [Giardia muris]|uniref:3'(2'),5'-bisphosphate nucleotidase n=1 Tax=Giardia muris TaxID=5742 RepID=A0A4Z1SSB8_GIAMU|nr:putative Inositol monophosphatase [Giardia muris]|eukprot:TNJ27885.1 putative Inositol monophosphatase [Giardia muris]
MSVNLQRWLEVAASAAIEAGKAIIEVVRDERGIEARIKENDGDFVTCADRSSQRIICSIFESAFPELSIYGEETIEPGGLDKTTRSQQIASITMKDMSLLQDTCPHVRYIPCQEALSIDDCFVLVDPLDGTFNYVNSCYYSVGISIGLCYQGEAIGGVMYYPFLSEEMQRQYDFLPPTEVMSNGERVKYPFLDDLVKYQGQPCLSLLYGIRYGSYYNCNLPSTKKLLDSFALSSSPSATNDLYLQTREFTPKMKRGLEEAVRGLIKRDVGDKRQREPHPEVSITTRGFYGALCKFREFLLCLGGCNGVIYYKGYLRAWDICAFAGIARALGLPVYVVQGSDEAPPTYPHFEAVDYGQKIRMLLATRMNDTFTVGLAACMEDLFRDVLLDT